MKIAESKRRLSVGLGGLLLVAALGLLASMLLVSNQAGATASVQQPPARPSFVLYNEGPGAVQVQVNQVARFGRIGPVVVTSRMILAQDIGRGQPILLEGPCRQQLWVQAHGRDYVVSGNFCPQEYPDEVKTLVVFGADDRRPEVAGEDVE